MWLWATTSAKPALLYEPQSQLRGVVLSLRFMGVFDALLAVCAKAVRLPVANLHFCLYITLWVGGLLECSFAV